MRRSIALRRRSDVDLTGGPASVGRPHLNAATAHLVSARHRHRVRRRRSLSYAAGQVATANEAHVRRLTGTPWPAAVRGPTRRLTAESGGAQRHRPC
ncbi:hypothetical protein ACIBP6_11735 [Nonomuraea terrae]|uniref:hypothetical protein n=1 Tax=Nonomuraea terrae TaxID=2530383 RepID=UPI00379F3A3C